MRRPKPTQKQILDALILLFQPEIRAGFEESIADIVDNVLLNRLTNQLSNGNVIAAFHTLGFSDAAMRPFIASIERSFEQGGVLTGSTFPKYLNTSDGRVVFRFDVRNSRAEGWLRENSSRLVTRIQDETRVNIRNVLQRGVEDGRNPRSVALDLIGRVDRQTGRRVGGVVGLTNRQEGWVGSVRRDLQNLDSNYFNKNLRDKRFDAMVKASIDADRPLTRDTITKLVNRYADNTLKYRGETIARTEAIQALNRSEWEATKQAVELGAANQSAVTRIWDTTLDGNQRHSHFELNDQKVGLDEPFVTTDGDRLLHPGDRTLGAPGDETINCRCRVRTKVDWLAEVE